MPGNDGHKNRNPMLDILLVEDSADDAFFFAKAMKEQDFFYSLSVAKNCDEFFALVKAGRNFDLIFMDINMPGKDGRECLMELKAIEKYRNIPVITFTSSQLQSDIDDMYKLGAHYHIIKPHAHLNYVLAL